MTDGVIIMSIITIPIIMIISNAVIITIPSYDEYVTMLLWQPLLAKLKAMSMMMAMAVTPDWCLLSGAARAAGHAVALWAALLLG